mmetsp:Transcript_22243/g.52577  ORF Transcript_22243/g.52577 Transcript_22243/m.52577 type:complete len:237 (+) Transcript_22243:1218-1928(+)
MQVLDALGARAVLVHEALDVGGPVGAVVPLRRREVVEGDVDVDGGVHAREQPVQHPLLVAHLLQVSHLLEAVLVVDRIPHVRAVVAGPALRVQLQVQVVRRVGGDVAAHIEPEVRQRGVVARLKLERRLLPARNLHVHLVGCLGVPTEVLERVEVGALILILIVVIKIIVFVIVIVVQIDILIRVFLLQLWLLLLRWNFRAASVEGALTFLLGRRRDVCSCCCKRVHWRLRRALCL